MKNKIIKFGIFLLILLVIPHDNSISIIENYNENESRKNIQLISNRTPENSEVEGPVGYLIITVEQFRGAIISLVIWKMQKGLNATIKTIEEIEIE